MQVITQFLKMETLLDDSVNQKVELQIERGGTSLTVNLMVRVALVWWCYSVLIIIFVTCLRMGWCSFHSLEKYSYMWSIARYFKGFTVINCSTGLDHQLKQGDLYLVYKVYLCSVVQQIGLVALDYWKFLLFLPQVQDLHSITPDYFLEVSGAVIHPLSYQQVGRVLLFLNIRGYSFFPSLPPDNNVVWLTLNLLWPVVCWLQCQ